MARLIDADALRLMKVEECANHSIEYAMGWKACIEWIKDKPTVDAIPVDWMQACIKIAELFCDEHNEKLLQTLINLWHRDGYGFFKKREGQNDGRV